MHFTFEGEKYDLTGEIVHLALEGQRPGEIHRYWVDVGGVRWPVKEAISLATSLARTRFTSRDAQKWLRKAGFVINTSAPSNAGVTKVVTPNNTGFDASVLEPLSTSELSLKFTWLRAGELNLDDNQLPVFPPLPASPGLYRFDFGCDEEGIRAVYIGESRSLRQRASNYRNAKTDRPRQRTSRRIHKELVAHLADGRPIQLAIATEILLSGSAIGDLRLRSSRRLAENAAVLLAQMSPDVTVMNIDEVLAETDSSEGVAD